MQGQPMPTSHVPLIGQQPTQKQAAEIQVMQAINHLSLGIYSHLAVGHIATVDVHETIDTVELQQMAKNSHLAAKAYFEGLGVIEAKGS